MSRDAGNEQNGESGLALDVWLDFLGHAAADDEQAFERLCVERPRLAAELRELRSEERAEHLPAALPTTVESRLRELARPVNRGARFERRGVLARGGMGVVHRVQDVELQRTLALKEMLCASGADRTLAAGRFLEEAQVTAQLDHPGIVPVHEVGVDGAGRIYFAMKLVNGRDLKAVFDLVRAGQQGWTRTRALGVLLKVCEAMSYAHSKGVIHRDLKPGNVMVGRFGEVYVMDWGLAHVLGRADSHDIRLQLQSGTAFLSTSRRAERESTPDSPLLTMDGVVIGTPAYMPPEQARGDIQSLSPRSDVYSIGAMLYHLLTGTMPYVPDGARISKHALLYRVMDGPPPRIRAVDPRVPHELAAICEKAMAREPRQRYASMQALAEDLRAYLEDRVVRAYERGALAELKKWIVRNRGAATAAAAALVLLVAGLATSVFFKLRADRDAERADRAAEEALRQAEAAQRNEREARSAQERARANEQLALSQAEDALRRSALLGVDELVRRADLLWPAHPENLPRFDDWLREARELLDGRAGFERRLEALRSRGRLAEQAPRAHPRAHELAAARRDLAQRRERRAALTSGAHAEKSAQDLGIDFDALPQDAAGLHLFAWPFVDRNRPAGGNEQKALVLARRAVDLADLPEQRAPLLHTLALALFANGRLDEALREEERALEEAGDVDRARLQKSLDDMLAASEEQRSAEGLRRADQEIAALEAQVAALEAAVAAGPIRVLPTPEEQRTHDELQSLLQGLDRIALLAGADTTDEHGWGITKRRELTATLERESVAGTEAAARWTEAVASIGDGERCPAYRGLALGPQMGLLPLGPDPRSGLWEFAHLASGAQAVRDASGELVLTDETGLVLVLLPGGTSWMGAQRDRPGLANYDASGVDSSHPVHDVTLSPFFLSKYEMTQAQWLRATGRNPSRYKDMYLAKSLRHPVELVSWNQCRRTLERLGLALPSEAQWEHAARGGRSSVWWTGDDETSLRGAANLADVAAAAEGLGQNHETWLDDGAAAHADVQRYLPNPFGLHNVHGNVEEWCLDAFDEDYYFKSLQLDPVCDSPEFLARTTRGGSFNRAANTARCAQRMYQMPDYASPSLGVRPARALAR